jgi:hypothetical protein
MSQASAFLFLYKSLIEALNQASTSKELVHILCVSSGNDLLPSIIFDTNGQLKSFEQLRGITHEQLRLIIKQNTSSPSISLLLIVNQQKYDKSLRGWKLRGTPAASDAMWFTRTFQVTPVSGDTIRAVLLSKQIMDLRLYLTKDQSPRTDIVTLLAEVRQQVAVARQQRQNQE